MAIGHVELENVNGRWIGDAEVGARQAKRVRILADTLEGAIEQARVAFGVEPEAATESTIDAQADAGRKRQPNRKGAA